MSNHERFLGMARQANKDELFAAALLEEEGFSFVTTSPTGTVGWDFSMTIGGDEYLFEHKTDYSCKKYNNVAIEYGRINGDVSGIAATNADFVVYMVSRPDDTYVLAMGQAETFKKLLNNPHFRDSRAGDGLRTLVKLVPYDTFIKTDGIVTVGNPFGYWGDQS